MSREAFNRILKLRNEVEDNLDSKENMIKYACYTECLHIIGDYVDWTEGLEEIGYRDKEGYLVLPKE